ncbi:MAG: hypothetical protein OQK51_08835 [Kangiellaceae bacterium]|nr:hypothetical protein [Kangiellaceae bacterium]
MKNIGTVVYTKWIEPGTLKARWSHSEGGEGVGDAHGGPDVGFAGEYRIVYQNNKGDKSPEMLLRIREADTGFLLEWLEDEKLVSIGQGMVVGEQLIAGWKDVE